MELYWKVYFNTVFNSLAMRNAEEWCHACTHAHYYVYVHSVCKHAFTFWYQ